jgi:hypothetical protein
VQSWKMQQGEREREFFALRSGPSVGPAVRGDDEPSAPAVSMFCRFAAILTSNYPPSSFPCSGFGWWLVGRNWYGVGVPTPPTFSWLVMLRIVRYLCLRSARERYFSWTSQPWKGTSAV